MADPFTCHNANCIDMAKKVSIAAYTSTDAQLELMQVATGRANGLPLDDAQVNMHCWSLQAQAIAQDWEAAQVASAKQVLTESVHALKLHSHWAGQADLV